MTENPTVPAGLTELPAGIGTANGIVQIAYLHLEHVSHSWSSSMRDMWLYDSELPVPHQRIAVKPLDIRCSSGRLVPSRNFATKLFLDKTAHEWLFFVDTDMGFEPDAIHRLLEVADPAERPVVGGLCFAMMESEHDGMGGRKFTIVPTMYKIGHTVEGGKPSFCYYGDYIDDAVTPVAATGAAFLLIHRSALEKVRAEVGDHWWDQIYDADGGMVGEDFSFCLRLGHAGIPVHVHTGVKTTHHKEIHLSEVDYQKQAALSTLPTVGHPEIPPAIHVGASLATLVTNAHVRDDGMLKLDDDLTRYQSIIEATEPQVIIETGTRTGASARWFAALGVEVITVDVEPREETDTYHPGAPYTGVTYLCGNSVDPAMVQRVAELVAGRRCMVSLDSDHSAEHVAAEIQAYGPMVSDGCYLVVEDGIFGLAPQRIRDKHFPAGLQGSPLDAIVSLLHDNPGWSRDIAVEQMTPVSHHPAGWWVRNG